MREVLRGWLGISQAESTAAQASDTLATDVRDLEASVANLREGASAKLRQWLQEELQKFRDTHALERSGMNQHLASLESTIGAVGVKLEQHLTAPENPLVSEPVTCPCGHNIFAVIMPLWAIDADDPNVQEIRGAAVTCTKCKKAFYYEVDDRGRRHLRASDKDAEEITAPATEEEEPKAPRRAEPHFRRVRRML